MTIKLKPQVKTGKFLIADTFFNKKLIKVIDS